MKLTPDQIEETRLLKVIANTDASAFELEDARERLAVIVERRDPTCVYCEKRRSTHEKAACPVVASFQRSHGKGLFPTPTQAAEIATARR